MAAPTVAIIGAGVSGLTSIKACLEENLNPTCFEQTDVLGGLWQYSDNLRYKQGSACYKNLTTNTPANMMAFSDFPYPPGTPLFPTHDVCLNYLKLYVEKFGLERYVRFSTEVIRVTFDENYQKWRVYTKTVSNSPTSADSEEKLSQCESDLFDFVMVCNGCLKTPIIPDFRGKEDFEGTVTHSNSFRDGVKFRDQKVVVVGAGNSAGDIACEIAKLTNSTVHLSTNRGIWLVTRYWYPGMVTYMPQYATRFANYFNIWTPTKFYDSMSHRVLNQNINHQAFNLNPCLPASKSKRPMLSDDIIPLIGSGRIKLVPSISELGTNQVYFVDGSKLDNINAVVCATGYNCDFSAIDKEVFGGPLYEDTKLYQNVWPINEKFSNTLAVIGAVSVDATPPVTELQARWAVSVFVKKCKLPAVSKMEQWLNKFRKEQLETNSYLSMKMPFIPYQDFMASQIGCYPSILRILWNFMSFKLVWKLLFGSYMPFQYRLIGPHSWKTGAWTMYKEHHKCVDFLNY